jgi:AcrR family transcriptional regulator
MTRPKTITNEEILAAARGVFRAQGHAATTRDIAQAAGISEGILYQRFGSKDDLFFASMAPSPPDLEVLLGPDPPTEEPATFVKSVLLRMAAYFCEVIPLALHIMTHPSFDPAALGRASAGAARLSDALARRLAWFETHKLIRKATATTTAQLLVSLAHDSALPVSPGGVTHKTGELDAMAAIVWNGIALPAPTERPPPKRR